MANASPTVKAEIVTMLPDCTIRSIDAAYSKLRQATQAAAIQLDCSEVEQADITFVQLVVSAQTTFTARGIHLTLDSVPDCIRAVFARSGICLPGTGQSLSS